MTTVRTGLDVLLDDPSPLAGKRVGLVTNPSGIDRQLRTSIDLLVAHPDIEIVALFGPEHGVRGEAQAGEHVASGTDERSGLPSHSLYGATRQPTPEMLDGIDVLLVDLQDIGVRYATYLSTVAALLDATHPGKTTLTILDRPNPWGGIRIDGNVLEPAFSSFVGTHPIPILHGLTIGEFARLRAADHDQPEPHVVPMTGWSRDLFMDETGLPWVPPSPNLPTMDSILAYPATCLIEGTTLSEGRGTTRPFEVFGAPWIDPDALRAQLLALDEPGLGFRSTWFTPMFSKHAGTRCGGVQLYVHDRDAFVPTRFGVRLLAVLHRLTRDREFWLTPPGRRYFVDLLLGSADVRLAIDQEEPLEPIVDRWRLAHDAYGERFAAARLY